MFDLEKREFRIIVFLVFSLLFGLGVAVYKNSHQGASIDIGKFDTEDLKLRYAEDMINDRKTVNINAAGAEELMRLEGVGKVMAERIVEYRMSNGSFRSISEIKNVKGIGEKLFERIKNNISVE